MKATLPAIFSKITSKADRSYKLEFESRELSGKDASVLMNLLHQEGHLLFSPNPLQESDIPDEKADSMTNRKTQAQRLRGCLFKVWETKGSPGSFETYYQSQMELIIEQVKSKIDL
jgi:hypothetical protein